MELRGAKSMSQLRCPSLEDQFWIHTWCGNGQPLKKLVVECGLTRREQKCTAEGLKDWKSDVSGASWRLGVGT